MISAHPIADLAEEKRLNRLASYQILDTPAEAAYDELTRLASYVCQTPVAFVSFIDANRQWNKSRYGSDLVELPREKSFCAHAIINPGLFVVENLAADPRFSSASCDNGPFQFYAAAPLFVEEGVALGALCVLDYKPRTLDQRQMEALEILSKQVVTQLELRRNLLELRAEQAATKLALNHSESFYSSLVETLPQNIFRKDLEGRFTFANSRFCSEIGKTQQEVIGKTDFDFFPKELAVKYKEDDQQVIASQTTLRMIEKHQAPDGKILYVQVIKSPYFHDGKVAGLQGIFWDETDRFRAEEALAQEKHLLRSMLRAIPDSIYFKDRQSRFLACSDALARRLGLNHPSEAEGKNDLDFFESQHAKQAFEDEQRIMTTGEPIIAKTERERWADGQERWVLTTKVPLLNPMGSIIGTFGISKDITDLKVTEAALAEARDAALETARVKSEFLANMSHEIRTPLNAVIGMSGLLLDTNLTEEQRDFAETIRTSGDALLGIINDILDYSKMEAGKMAIEQIEFDLGDVVESTLELLAEPARAKELELISYINPVTPKALIGDPGRVRQVLTNLISNAVKFTEKGEVVVNVIGEQQADGQVRVQFTVRDTGIGIPEHAHGRIFQVFTQADGSTTRKYGGTGLGLSICKELVRLMNGEIGFTSKPKVGSTFWFTLPFGIQSPRQDKKELPTTFLEGVKAIVVDDNQTNRQIIHHQIGAWKMRSGMASNAFEALAALHRSMEESDPYRVVILDMQMPEMDGLTLARIIRNDPRFKQLKLLMLTSVGYLPEERSWKEMGVDAYLIKPVKQLRLLEALLGLFNDAQNAMSHQRFSATENAHATKPNDARRHSIRVLVAEDNPVNQRVALRQLQKLGFSADTVANGVEALQALPSIPYQLALMDCQMPEMDGYETTRKIRELEAARKQGSGEKPLHIIAMTANALTGDKDKCIAAGMNDYISKPVRIQELEAALQRGIASLEKTVEQEAEKQKREEEAPTLDQATIQGLRDLRDEDDG
ncbi:MAG: response regulator, partial [Verrucomicrobiales bacterium]